MDDTPDQRPALISALLAQARIHHSPCADGVLQWHCWGPTPSAAALPAVVLLHGGSGSWTHWARNITALTQAGRPVLVPDLPGFGDSARPPGGRDADALPAPLEQGLAQLLPAGAAAPDLVGFSFGGLTGGLWAQAQPGRFRQLVLVGAPGLGIAARGKVLLQGWRHLSDPAAVQAAHQHNLGAMMLHQPSAITPLALWIHSHNVVRDRLPGRRLAYSDALRCALPAITCPVSAIYGQADALYQGQQDELAPALATAADWRGLHWVENAGHWVQFEQAQRFDSLLAQLLEQGAQPRPGR